MTISLREIKEKTVLMPQDKNFMKIMLQKLDTQGSVFSQYHNQVSGRINFKLKVKYFEL
jgi:hypothetical protein